MSDRSGPEQAEFQNELLCALESGRRREGGFAMLSVILLIMVVTALSVLMLGVVVAQVNPTVFQAKSTRTISAAEAGIDATLSQLRTATRTDLAGNVYGDPHKLPCAVSGTVGGATVTLTYDVQIAYFSANPAGMNSAWRSANQAVCTPGNGMSYSPSFAVITSKGADSALAGYSSSVGNRTLETVYTFQVVNQNVAGGIMWDWGRAACLKAGGSTPGSSVSYVAAGSCTDGDLTLWSYKPDYTIRLASTDFTGASAPLCLTGRNSTVAVQPCVAGQTNQKFAWYDGARFFVLNSSGTTTQSSPSYCISTGSSVADPIGSTAYVGGCGYNVPWSSFDPDPRVGAGKASAYTGQIVSFQEFGRCFDDTDTIVSRPFMILYPCKQAPGTLESVMWNQQWWYTEAAGSVGSTATQQIRVYQNGNNSSSTTYCLRSPLTAGGYVTLALCNSGVSGLNWVRTANTGTYSTSWTFTDSSASHLCITVGDPSTDPNYAYLSAWSTIKVAACEGGPDQKWNAPWNAQSSTLDNYKELNN